MSEQETLKIILQNNSVLTESNLKLSLSLAQSINRQKKLETYIKESYEALSDKSERNFHQECQYQYLKKLLVDK